jgi:tripartite-type tricarboxylate transporter receptor subunit TctC
VAQGGKISATHFPERNITLVVPFAAGGSKIQLRALSDVKEHLAEPQLVANVDTEAWSGYG